MSIYRREHLSRETQVAAIHGSANLNFKTRKFGRLARKSLDLAHFEPDGAATPFEMPVLASVFPVAGFVPEAAPDVPVPVVPAPDGDAVPAPDVPADDAAPPVPPAPPPAPPALPLL